MIQLLSLLSRSRDSITAVQLAGSSIQVISTARADAALKRRDGVLIVEAELTFACIAHKQVRFHDRLAENTSHSRILRVHDKLILQLTTVIPASCAMPEGKHANNLPVARNFTPHWIRIDHVNNHWQGEYGLSAR